MAALLNLLAWCALIFSAGGSLARVVSVRPRWLVVPAALVAVLFWIAFIPTAWGGVTAAGFALVLLVNLLFWAAGVYAGTRARREAPPGHASRVASPR